MAAFAYFADINFCEFVDVAYFADINFRDFFYFWVYNDEISFKLLTVHSAKYNEKHYYMRKNWTSDGMTDHIKTIYL